MLLLKFRELVMYVIICLMMRPDLTRKLNPVPRE
jgi:hypothetical protein